MYTYNVTCIVSNMSRDKVLCSQVAYAGALILLVFGQVVAALAVMGINVIHMRTVPRLKKHGDYYSVRTWSKYGEHVFFYEKRDPNFVAMQGLKIVTNKYYKYDPVDAQEVVGELELIS